jgi:hypothetical protein
VEHANCQVNCSVQILLVSELQYFLSTQNNITYINIRTHSIKNYTFRGDGDENLLIKSGKNGYNVLAM